MTQVPYMGHLRTREGLRVDPKKVEAIEKMPPPKDAKAVQRLLAVGELFGEVHAAYVKHHAAPQQGH